MIKANELRIDNWLKSNLNPTAVYVRVTALPLGRQHSEWQIEANYGDYNFEDLEPIPLTTEILEKSGFEELQQSNGWFCIYGLEGLELSVNTNNFEICIDKQYQIYLGKNFPVKYLHQLQNLYFALTGQELEINL